MCLMNFQGQDKTIGNTIEEKAKEMITMRYGCDVDKVRRYLVVSSTSILWLVVVWSAVVASAALIGRLLAGRCAVLVVAVAAEADG